MEVATEVFEAHNWRGDAWLWGGDFNDEPEEAGAAAVALAEGGEVVPGCEEGTRWESSRKVDWFTTNAPGKVRSYKNENELRMSSWR